jgi:4-aminobutyrate aminotransferase
MPLAAIVVRPDLDVAPEAALGHYTHEKSPVAAAAALATLDVIEEERLVERARVLGKSSLERLRGMADETGCLTEVRGLGLFFGAEVAGDDAGDAARRAETILYAALERGLSFKIGGGNVLTLCPPLNIPEAQLERAFDILEAAARTAA